MYRRIGREPQTVSPPGFGRRRTSQNRRLPLVHTQMDIGHRSQAFTRPYRNGPAPPVSLIAPRFRFCGARLLDATSARTVPFRGEATVPFTAAVFVALLEIFDTTALSQGASTSGAGAAPPLPADQDSAAAVREVPQSTWRLHIRNPHVRDSARRILGQAAEWLSFPECQQLLSEFTDRDGRQLTAKLREIGVTVVEYLTLIVFEDGDNRGACRRRGILAFTAPGSRVIYLCGQDFARAVHVAPEEMRAVIIHEVLHSLGLGENPPTSKEITYRVKQRCWR